MRFKNLSIPLAVIISSTSPAFAETVIVERGDTLSKIAVQALGAAERWSEICEANKAIVSDCNKLRVGVELTVPDHDGVESITTSISSSASDPADPGIVDLDMQCSDLPGAPGFSRVIPISLDDGVVSYLSGTAGEMDYEKWDGVVAVDGSLRIEGEYIQGGPDLKPIQFEGTVVSGIVNASGTRGPRSCTITSVSP